MRPPARFAATLTAGVAVAAAVTFALAPAAAAATPGIAAAPAAVQVAPAAQVAPGVQVAPAVQVASGVQVAAQGAALPDSPPVNVGTRQIDDQAGVGADTSAAQQALDQLRSKAHVGLYVVLIDTFGGVDKQTWAQQSFTSSNLGSNDILLAIAVNDHRFGWVDQQGTFPLSNATVDSIFNNDAAPHMASQDWSGAIVAAAQGLQSAIVNGGSAGNAGVPGTAGTSSSSRGSLGWLWFVVIIGVAVLVFLWVRASRRGKQAAATAKKNAGPPPEPYQHLSDRSVNALIQTDNAVRASESELQLAEGEFGTQATADFRAAHDDAKDKLTKAFQLRQEIDDEIPEDEATRRGWMAQILQLCQQATDGLAAQTDQFGKLRNLKSRLPQVLASMPGDIDAQSARLPQAAATLQRLAGAYSAQALATVEGNTDQANERLQFARTSLGEAGKTAGDVDNGPAVLAARAAQEAIKQATTLLDAIDRLDHDLAAAAAQLATARVHVTSELADASTALAQGSAGAATADIRQRLAGVQSVLDATSTADAGRDPVTSLKKLTDADHALDDILAATRTAQQQEKRARATLQSELVTAQSTVSAVDDYISTRRGAMNSTARTRLAEARRHLQNAQDQAATDATAALSEAQRATDLARQAYAEAHDDIDRWNGGHRSGMGGVGGALLGGILLGSLLDGNRGGGWGGGGWGGGGFGGGWGGGGGGFGGGGGSFGGGGGGFGGGGGSF